MASPTTPSAALIWELTPTILREVEEETGLHAAAENPIADPSARLPFIEDGQEVDLYHLSFVFSCKVQGRTMRI